VLYQRQDGESSSETAERREEAATQTRQTCTKYATTQSTQHTDSMQHTRAHTCTKVSVCSVRLLPNSFLQFPHCFCHPIFGATHRAATTTNTSSTHCTNLCHQPLHIRHEGPAYGESEIASDSLLDLSVSAAEGDTQFPEHP
jgi:hypothetical protein